MSKSVPPAMVNGKILLQDDDVEDHPVTASTDYVRVEICGKSYDFSKEMVQQYPKLLDPSIRFTLNFDSVLPLLYGYPPSCISETLLDEQSEKEIFLSNVEFLGIKLSNEVILHLNQQTRKELLECRDFIKSKTGSKGKKKLRFMNDPEIEQWCAEVEASSLELYDSIKPGDILRKLEAGCIDILTLWDFKGKNVVRSLLKQFKQKFFPS